MEKHGENGWKNHWKLLLAVAILFAMLALEYGFNYYPDPLIGLGVYLFAYILAGHNVLLLAWRKALRLDFFNEFFLMSVATMGAFAIGSYSEGVAVMVFYSIGEWFQDSAVDRAKRNIKALLDIRPDEVSIIRGSDVAVVNPREVEIGEKIRVKPGEKVALDGILLSDSASFNTAALTGESMPDTKSAGQPVLAGMINLNTTADVEVTALFRDSKLSRILEMVQDATARKSKTQLFISRFAKVYTPIVFALAVMVVLVPWLFVEQYDFRTWFYRALVFLVISCPCALVVSIPLGYFGGIGLASRNGILVKGANYLDIMTQIDTLVMDKTGTITKGEFTVTQVSGNGMDKAEILAFAAALETQSTHPIAQAILNHASKENLQVPKVTALTEIPGHGLSGTVTGRSILAGNLKLLKKFQVEIPAGAGSGVETVVFVAVDQQFAGTISISDTIKDDAAETISALHRLNIHTVMLSGDKPELVKQVAGSLGIKESYGGLLPEDKVAKVEQLKAAGRRIAFMGDGVNDAPVVALADAGIAMGGLGSDATIETADIVIQNDRPSKIISAIKAGRITKNIVWQNIGLAMVVKVAVLVLGAGGIATLWEAVIADVGVALLAILNAVRIQNIKI